MLADGEAMRGDRLDADRGRDPPGPHFEPPVLSRWKNRARVFTGDHVMGLVDQRRLCPPDGDMGDYMASLEKLLAREDVRLSLGPRRRDRENPASWCAA